MCLSHCRYCMVCGTQSKPCRKYCKIIIAKVSHLYASMAARRCMRAHNVYQYFIVVVVAVDPLVFSLLAYGRDRTPWCVTIQETRNKTPESRTMQHTLRWSHLTGIGFVSIRTVAKTLHANYTTVSCCERVEDTSHAAWRTPVIFSRQVWHAAQIRSNSVGCCIHNEFHEAATTP